MLQDPFQGTAPGAGAGAGYGHPWQHTLKQMPCKNLQSLVIELNFFAFKNCMLVKLFK